MVIPIFILANYTKFSLPRAEEELQFNLGLYVQSVVASLASDKNVWDAVMKNEKVMQFYRNHQSSKRL